MEVNEFVVLGLDGSAITHLNSRLAVRQNVNSDQLRALRASHVLRKTIFDIAKLNTDHPMTLQMLARMFDHLENEQQELWNFGANPDFHRFFDMPGCTCPRMDNEERLGTPYHIYSSDCPIHGDQISNQVMSGRIQVAPEDIPEVSDEEARQLRYHYATKGIA